MYIWTDCWGKSIEIKEVSDFKVGDKVMLPNSLQKFSGYKGVPQYLAGDVLVVEKLCRKNLKCSNAKYPNEYWFVDPATVEIIKE